MPHSPLGMPKTYTPRGKGTTLMLAIVQKLKGCGTKPKGLGIECTFYHIPPHTATYGYRFPSALQFSGTGFPWLSLTDILKLRLFHRLGGSVCMLGRGWGQPGRQQIVRRYNEHWCDWLKVTGRDKMPLVYAVIWQQGILCPGRHSRPPDLVRQPRLLSLSCQQVGDKQFKLQSKLNKNVKNFLAMKKTFWLIQNPRSQICLVSRSLTCISYGSAPGRKQKFYKKNKSHRLFISP